MAESMYDRLGDLLSETLDAGKVKFVKVEKSYVPPRDEEVSDKASEFFKPQNESDPVSFKANRESEKNASEQKVKQRAEKEKAEKSSYETYGEYAAKKESATIYKNYEYVSVPPEVEKALALFSLNINSNHDELKKAYKEKLKAFHPDMHSGTAAGKRIAEEKTRQVVEAYRVLVSFWHY